MLQNGIGPTIWTILFISQTVHVFFFCRGKAKGFGENFDRPQHCQFNVGSNKLLSWAHIPIQTYPPQTFYLGVTYPHPTFSFQSTNLQISILNSTTYLQPSLSNPPTATCALQPVSPIHKHWLLISSWETSGFITGWQKVKVSSLQCKYESNLVFHTSLTRSGI